MSPFDIRVQRGSLLSRYRVVSTQDSRVRKRGKPSSFLKDLYVCSNVRHESLFYSLYDFH